MKKILNHKLGFNNIFLFIMFAFLTGSCKKENLYNSTPLLNVANQSPSSIRLYNFYGNADVTVNSVPLTAYAIPNTGSAGGTALGLSIFPTGIWSNGGDASPFTLPNSLLDKDGKAHFSISANNSTLAIDTTITNNVAHPQNYYLMPNGHFKVINRDNVLASNPQNFKIRIINLGSNVYGDPLGLNLNGPVSLTYADGSPVDPGLNNVAQGVSSGYIELPYRAYQFKLFIANGAIDVTKQLAEFPIPPYYIQGNYGPLPQEGITPTVRTFKPGGIYSIVVSENMQGLFTDVYYINFGANVNSYRIITEFDPGVNSTYAAMQSVNAMPGKNVTINVDGQPLGGVLPYIGSVSANTAQQAPYQVYIQGNHHVQAKDQSGNVLAEGDINLFPYDNYTIWAYNGPDGKPGLLFEPNDMSGTVYASSYILPGSTSPSPDDGTNGTLRRDHYKYALQSRFLNLAPDLPYATFTNDNQLFAPALYLGFGDTIRYSSAYINLAPGIMPLQNSSIIYSLPYISPAQGITGPFGNSEQRYLPQFIRVYHSKPAPLPEVPGALITDVTPIDVSQAFIANPDLYTFPQSKVAETGIYTVALVGKINALQASEKATLIVIKHNK